MSKTPCICENPGMCPLHDMIKTAHMHKLCQNHPGYFKMWEECRGPGQDANCGKKEVQTPQNIQEVSNEAQATKVEVGLWQQAKNFTKSMTEHAKSGFTHVSEEEKKARLDVCNGCEKFIKETNRCSSCGCFLSTKASLSTSHCPLLKWPKEANHSR